MFGFNVDILLVQKKSNDTCFDNMLPFFHSTIFLENYFVIPQKKVIPCLLFV